MTPQEVARIKEDAIKLFLIKTERLFYERVRDEAKLVDQYKNREIFELLQNIDDALLGSDASHRVASINFDGEKLVAANNGLPFTSDTLMRLSEGRVSAKHGKYIGSKGIGFRSVLNWADQVRIYSGHGRKTISVEFSRQHAQKQFKLIKSDSHIAAQIEELQKQNITPVFPMFKAPEYIEPRTKCFDTEIELLTINDPEIRNRIRFSLKNLDGTMLLFLPNIQEIEILVDGKQTRFYKEENKKLHIVTLIKVTEGVEDYRHRYYVKQAEKTLPFKHEGSDTVKTAVALPVDDASDDRYQIFTFFPIMGLVNPFRAHLHATFCLTDNRNDLDLSYDKVKDVNREVFCFLLEQYVDAVTEFCGGSERLERLFPDGYINRKYRFTGSPGLILEIADYLQICRLREIFWLTVGCYAKGNARELLLFERVPEGFRTFPNIVNPIAGQDMLQFARDIALNECQNPEHYLFDAINQVSDSWSPSARIDVFKWWWTRNYSSLPNLLKSDHGQFITKADGKVYLTRKFNDVPQWANITIPDTDDLKCLLLAFKEEMSCDSEDSDLRLLSRISFRCVEFVELSSRKQIISPVNKAVGNDYARSCEFVKWLYKIWTDDKVARKNRGDATEEPFSQSVSDIKFNLPTTQRSVLPIDRLYLGAAFGNKLGETLFAGSEYYQTVADDVIDNSKDFFKNLGVPDFPVADKIDFGEIYPWDDRVILKEYINSLTPKDDRYKNPRNFEAALYSIHGIERVLSEAPSLDIIKWIFSDICFFMSLTVNDSEPVKSEVKCMPRIQGNIYSKAYSAYLPSYMRFVMSNTAWLEIDGRRYAPKQLLISNFDCKITDRILFISRNSLARIAERVGVTMAQLVNVLTILGTASSYADLKSDFYDILLNLPNYHDKNISHNISREIYREIIEWGRVSDSIPVDTATDATKSFFRDGKVLARRGGEISFLPITDVKFSSSAVLNVRNLWLLAVPPRSGKKEMFQKVLGVRPYNESYKVSSYVKSPCNEKFCIDFADFLKCLTCYRKYSVSGSNAEFNLFFPSVCLVSKVEISEDGRLPQEITEKYKLIKKSRLEWLIYVEGISEVHKLNKTEIARRLQDVFNVGYNYPAKDFLEKVLLLYILPPEERRNQVAGDLGVNVDNEQNKSDIPTSGITDNYENYRLLKACISRRKKEYEQAVYAMVLRYDLPHGRLKEYWNFFEVDDNPANLTDADFSPESFVDAAIDEIVAKDFEQGRYIPARDIPDYGKTYSENLTKLQELAGHKTEYINEFTNTAQNDSLLYFDDFDQIRTSFLAMVNSKGEVPETVKSGLNIDDLVKQFQPEIVVTPNAATLPNDKTYAGNGSTTVSNREKHNQDVLKIGRGDAAEGLVIHSLAKEEIAEVVEYLGHGYTISWKSGAAKRVTRNAATANVKVEETTDGCGYDIELISADESRSLYIEVKSSVGAECRFNLSDTEFNMAASGKHYAVIFVANMASNPKIAYLGNPIDFPEKYVYRVTGYEFFYHTNPITRSRPQRH